MPDSRSARRPSRVAIVGGTLSGNKGAASMLQAVVDRLPDVVGPCRFAVLSAYAEQDGHEPGAEGLVIVPWTPVQMLVDLPLALLAALARLVRLPSAPFCVTRSLRTLAEADVVADVAGISFVDGRGPVVLVYNVLMPLLPTLVGTPVVKCAQAVGPFEEPLNRALARWTLRRVTRVFARGQQTAAHLRELGVHAEEAADLAFVLGLPPEDAAAGRARWPEGPGRKVAVVPSAVVEAYCAKRSIDYVGLMASFVDALAAEGWRVLLFPHSARPGARASRMNDLPVCEAIAARASSEQVVPLVESLSPHVLRGVIASADVLVAARFHAMISALASGTPVLVTGWSHKYAEVLGQFGLAQWQIPYEDLSLDTLLARFKELDAERDAVRSVIARSLPVVQDSAMRNLEALGDIVAA